MPSVTSGNGPPLETRDSLREEMNMEKIRYEAVWDDTWHMWNVVDRDLEPDNMEDFDDETAIVARCDFIDDAMAIAECLNVIVHER
jgi:aspartyl/asparaginyl beta-hydroxylase (cupin superfamily)